MNWKIIDNKKIWMVFLVLSLVLILIFKGDVYGQQSNSEIADQKWLLETMDKYYEDYKKGNSESQKKFNEEWDSNANRRKMLISFYSNLGIEKIEGLWEILDDENKKEMFDLMTDEQRYTLWRDILDRNKDNNEPFKLTSSQRLDLLNSLTNEQKTKMLELIMKGWSGKEIKLRGLEKLLGDGWTLDYQLTEKSELVVLAKGNEKHTIPLYNLPLSLKEIAFAMEDGKTRVQATIETGSGTDKKTTLVFLEEGHYLQKRIKDKNEVPNQVDVMKTDGSYLSTLDYADSENAVFLVGTPKGGSLGEPKKGIHIWTEGHYDGTGASIIKYDNGNWVYSVFPNPKGAKDDKGRNYAFVAEVEGNENVYNVYGNFLKQGGFGAVVYKTLDGVLDFSGSYPGENVLHVVKKGEDNNAKWNIKAEEGIVSNVVFKVKGIENKDEFKNDFVYYQESGWVPRAGSGSDSTNRETETTRVGGGAGPINPKTRKRVEEVSRRYGEETEQKEQPKTTEETTKQEPIVTADTPRVSGTRYRYRTRVFPRLFPRLRGLR